MESYFISKLQHLTEVVEQAGVDIATTYNDYLKLCCGIANNCGEAGREYFIRLCKLSAKFDADDATRMYTDVQQSQKRYYNIHHVFELARKAGVEVDDLKTFPPKIPESEGDYQQPAPPTLPPVDENWAGTEASKVAKVAKVAPLDSPAHTRVSYNGETEPLFSGSDPINPLPIIPSYTWPHLMQRIIDLAAQTQEQRDILFFTTVAASGICLAHMVRTLYGKHYYHPCLQLFVVAPPASGKGVMGSVRHLIDPFHREIRQQVEQARKEYEQRMAEITAAGKKKCGEEMPEKPINKMFLIPGDNTGTGILQNLIDSDGWGIIFEAEADTLSSAIDSEYGKWSDTLRNAFDEGRLSYNRRGNGGEYREILQTFLSVVVSGTPAQLKAFVKTAEDGTFSRQIYYYMQPALEWIDQLSENNIDLDAEMDKLGEEWKKTCDRLKTLGVFTLKLSKEQKEQFNKQMDHLFQRSALANGLDMTSAVKRIAINLLRIMEVIAMMRLTDEMEEDDYDRPRELPLAKPYPTQKAQNKQNGLISHWQLSLNDDDFQAVLQLATVMYAHTVHVLSFLPGTQITRRGNAELDALLNAMPNPFTTQQFMEVAATMNVPANTAKSWLRRLTEENKNIEKVDRGLYRIVSETSSHARAQK